MATPADAEAPASPSTNSFIPNLPRGSAGGVAHPGGRNGTNEAPYGSYREMESSVRGMLSSMGAAGMDPNGQPVGSTGGIVPMQQSQYEQLDSLNRWAGGSRTPTANAGGGGLVNLYLSPMDTSAGRAAASGQSPMHQLAGGLALSAEQQQAYNVARQIQESGGFPRVGMDQATFNERSLAAANLIDKALVNPRSSFMPKPVERMAYMGSLGTGQPNTDDYRGRVIAANGDDVTGYGGNMASAVARPGGGYAFSLRQNQSRIGAAPAAPVNAFTQAPRSSSSFMPVAMPNGQGHDLTPGLEALRSGQSVQQLRSAGFNEPKPSQNAFLRPEPARTAPQGAFAPQPTPPAGFERLVTEYNSAVENAVNPKQVEPEVIDVGDGVRVLKTGSGYQQLPAKKQSSGFENGSIHTINGRQAVVLGQKFVDTETGAPLYTSNAFGEQVPNPIVFGKVQHKQEHTKPVPKGGGTKATVIMDRDRAPQNLRPADPIPETPNNFKRRRVKQRGVIFEFDGEQWLPVEE